MRQVPRLVLQVGMIALVACGGEPAAPPSVTPQPQPQSPNVPPEQVMPPAVFAYIKAVVDLMEANSINRQTINWSVFRGSVYEAGRTAQNIDQLTPAIRAAITGLADGHSSYRSASGVTVFVPNRVCSGTTAPPPTIPPTIGYVQVGGFSGSGAAATSFAAGIQNRIRLADHDSIIGWIVDLRGNGGGNMWPMIAGLGPIIGEDTIGFFIDPAARTVAWEYRGGSSMSSGFAVTTVSVPYTLKHERPKVAVLTDNRVASSGEATAIAFRARPNTRTFGFNTCGLSTANSGFVLSDGALLNLTISTMADRTRHKYGDRLIPDEQALDHDAAVQRAIAWLQAK